MCSIDGISRHHAMLTQALRPANRPKTQSLIGTDKRHCDDPGEIRDWEVKSAIFQMSPLDVYSRHRNGFAYFRGV